PLLALHSFPTRRSSDLRPLCGRRCVATQISWNPSTNESSPPVSADLLCSCRPDPVSSVALPVPAAALAHSCIFPLRRSSKRFDRSEEHTSELQSRGHLV